MRSDDPVPGSPEDWLRHARSDLALARQQVSPEVLLAALCFHAQQAAEKSLKAVLLHQCIVFPYTHDLAQLITLLKQHGVFWPEALDATADLTAYAVGTRYPGAYGNITPEEYTQAIEMAVWVVNWAHSLIRN
jgi:HEPN domain-containing protein